MRWQGATFQNSSIVQQQSHAIVRQRQLSLQETRNDQQQPDVRLAASILVASSGHGSTSVFDATVKIFTKVATQGFQEDIAASLIQAGKSSCGRGMCVFLPSTRGEAGLSASGQHFTTHCCCISASRDLIPNLFESSFVCVLCCDLTSTLPLHSVQTFFASGGIYLALLKYAKAAAGKLVGCMPEGYYRFMSSVEDTSTKGIVDHVTCRMQRKMHTSE